MSGSYPGSAPIGYVLLIGGTSHTGKSTLVRALVSRLGARYQPTDKLARHPGRPWRTPPEEIPPHVVEYFLTRSMDELLADVTRHYTDNVWPKVVDIATEHLAQGADVPLIIEGSAVMPNLAASLLGENVAGVWLTASRAFIRRRMYAESRYATRSPHGQKLIDIFLARAWRFDLAIMETVRSLGLVHLDVETAGGLTALIESVLSATIEQLGGHTA